jgi:sulfonate transport system substrate-binding protein
MPRWVAPIAFTTALLFFLSCVPIGPDDDMPRLRYGGQHYPCEYVLLASPELWSSRGVAVDHTLFSSGAEGNEALIAGSVDVNCGADTRTIALFNAIPDEALIIGLIQRGDRYVTVVRWDSPYRTWDDLMGKTVATRLGTGAEGVLRQYYSREGYEWEDFQYVNLKVEDMIASLDRGQIEAFTAWEPTPAIAEARGIGRALMTYGDVSAAPVCLHTTRTFARENEEALVRFLAGHLDKAKLMREDPAEASRLASSAASSMGGSVSPEAFETVFTRIDFTVDLDPVAIESIREMAEFLYQQGKISVKPELSWNASFLEQALRLVGTE